MKRLNNILNKVLRIEIGEIRDELTPKDVITWDSMNALIIVSELERTFDIKFTFKDITGVKCVGDIKEAVKRHGVVLDEAE